MLLSLRRLGWRRAVAAAVAVAAHAAAGQAAAIAAALGTGAAGAAAAAVDAPAHNVLLRDLSETCQVRQATSQCV